MKVAISGAGVSGPTLAFWLLRGGHQPTLIEAAPALRAGGYMIDFWGVGFEVADRMGLVPEVRQAGYALQEVRYLDARGRHRGSITAKTMRRELGDRFTSLPRGELAAIIFRSLGGHVETQFGVSIASIEQGSTGVEVNLTNGESAVFDLVIGADGLHSNVRNLAFGPESQFERRIGYYVAAFEAGGYRPRDELAYISCGVPGLQISRFALREDRTMFLFVFAAEQLVGGEPQTLTERKQTIKRVFGSIGWEWPKIAAALEDSEEVYFDRVSQIQMNAWSKGRVALVGDAAACVSLIAGEGTGLGMTEAYVLAGELSRRPDHAEALKSYETRMRKFIDGKQASTRRFASSFAPRTRLGLWLRNQAVRLMAVPGLPDLLAGEQMRDDFETPHYDFAAR